MMDIFNSAKITNQTSVSMNPFKVKCYLSRLIHAKPRSDPLNGSYVTWQYINLSNIVVQIQAKENEIKGTWNNMPLILPWMNLNIKINIYDINYFYDIKNDSLASRISQAPKSALASENVAESDSAWFTNLATHHFILKTISAWWYGKLLLRFFLS